MNIWGLKFIFNLCLFHQVECSFKEYEKKGAICYLHSERCFLFPTQKNLFFFLLRKSLSFFLLRKKQLKQKIESGGKNSRSKLRLMWVVFKAEEMEDTNPQWPFPFFELRVEHSLFVNEYSSLNQNFSDLFVGKLSVSKSTVSLEMGPIKLLCWSLF
mgnify:CR=1 FL=1